MLWGVVLASHAACTDFTGLIICRTLLGVFESCVAPINIFIIAMWYKQSEQARRISWYQVCSAVALVFGGLVSYIQLDPCYVIITLLLRSVMGSLIPMEVSRVGESSFYLLVV